MEVYTYIYIHMYISVCVCAFTRVILYIIAIANFAQHPILLMPGGLVYETLNCESES